MGKSRWSYIVFFLSVFFCVTTQAQTITKYWIKLIDKNGTPHTTANPSTYLSSKAIQRRTNQAIPITNNDLPVTPDYVQQIQATGATVLYTSKWLNAVVVETADPNIVSAVSSLTFVIGTQPVGIYKKNKEPDVNSTKALHYKVSGVSGNFDYGPSLTQAQMIGADCMHNLGYRGQGITIAVIDAGFDQADINPVFDTLRANNQILGTKDFVTGDNMVYEDNSHGAMVLSCIAGNTPGQLIGTGPMANFWLLRSEDVFSEKIIEEYNWVAAAEFADSVGADICTTSLGYTTFNIPSQDHTYADLNGKTSMASIAATIAASKGMFVINAAGNDGAGAWHYIGIPADADSICTVGSVSASGLHSGFSSVGPTADGRIKPEISTMGEGTYVCAPGFNFLNGNGTSFAAPVAAGAVACLWQAHPTATNMQLLNAIKQTASRSSHPDNDYGWGIPDFCAAHNLLTPVSVNELQNPFFVSVYPNPTKNKLVITFNQIQSNDVKISVTDLLGHSLININTTIDNNTVSLTTEFLNSGVYLLLIESGTQRTITKIIKE